MDHLGRPLYRKAGAATAGRVPASIPSEELMHSRPEDIVYQDVLWNLVGVLTAVVVAALAIMSVVAKADPSKLQTKAPGMLTVYVSWPADSCSDVDVWIGDPVDDKPVSYNHKHGELVDLLRDDMGCTLDRSSQNFEMATSHGIEPSRVRRQRRPVPPARGRADCRACAGGARQWRDAHGNQRVGRDT